MKKEPGALVKIFILLATLAPSAVVMPATAGAAEFKVLKKTGDGITVSRAEGKTKGFFVSRFDVRSPMAPDLMAEGLWRVFDNAYPPVARRSFISRAADELLFNDRVKTPVVSDREYTLRARRFRDGDTRRIAFRSDPSSGPPPDPKYVRMAMVEGGWWVWPTPDGGSLVRYEIYTEPGGLVPALLIKEPLTEDALNYVRRCIRDAALKR